MVYRNLFESPLSIPLSIYLLPEKLGSPLGEYRAKRHNQAKNPEKEGFIITYSK